MRKLFGLVLWMSCASVVFSQATPPPGLVAYGDSYTQGGIGGSPSYVSVMAPTFGGSVTNNGVAGDMSIDTAWNHVFNGNSSWNTTGTSVDKTIMIGFNDAHNFGVGAKEVIYTQTLQAMLALMAIPRTSLTFGQDAGCVQTSGVWDNWTQPTANGMAIHSETNGSVLTCTVTTGSSGVEYVVYYASDHNTGTLGVQIDGSTPGSNATLTAGYAGGFNIESPNGTSQTYWLARYTGLSAGSHAFKFTVTSGTGASQLDNAVAFLGSPVALAANSLTVYVGGIAYEQNDAASAAGIQYNSDAQTVATQLAGDGLPVVFVNIRNYLNSNTDYNGGTSVAPYIPISSCAMSTDLPLHPANCGYAHIGLAFINARLGAQSCTDFPYSYCGTTNVSSYHASPPSIGAAGTTSTDPDFHSVSLRVTQSGSCSEVAGGSFSPNGGEGWHNSWSIDDSKVMLNSEANNWYYQGINTATTPISFTGSCVGVKPAKFSYSPEFSKTAANKMYGFIADEKTLASWDTVAGDAVVNIKDFSGISGATWLANAARIGGFDQNDAWFCYTNNGQDVGTQVICYNQNTTNTQVLDVGAATSKQNSSVAVALDNLTTTQTANCGIHETTISPDGTWINVVLNGCTAWPVSTANMFWQLGTNHVTYVPNNFSSHSGMGFSAVYINTPGNQPPCGTSNAGWKMWPASNIGTTGSPNYVGVTACLPTEENMDGHMAWLNNRNDANVNAYPFIFMSNGPPASTNLNGLWEWEILAVQTQPALASLNASTFQVSTSGTVWRLGHTFNAPVPNQCAEMNYVSPNVSPDGKYVAYASDYQGGTGLTGDCTNSHRNDVFVLDVNTAINAAIPGGSLIPAGVKLAGASVQ